MAGNSVDGIPPATRPPTVVLTPENIERLERYPRPPRDNGRGLHFDLDLRQSSVARTVDRLRHINGTWTMIYAADELQAGRAAKACLEAGIMPAVRIARKIDAFVDAKHYVKALQDIGAPAYVQIYNEPSNGREWKGNRPSGYIDVFAGRWARHAATVVDAGGFPGLQVMGKDELDGAIRAVTALGRPDIWERAFFAVHNYGVNHPPAYPYDEVKQRAKPGCIILDDPVSILAFLAFARWMQDGIGFVLPIIGGEGGWQFGVDDDKDYPRVEQPLHAQYHCEVFNWFRTGVLSNGEPLPDYLFSVTPWIAGGWNTAEDWWGGPLGDKTETIEAVHALDNPPFVRRSSWDGEQLQPELEPEPEPKTEPAPAPDLSWDPRLGALGVRLTRSPEPSAWRLISAAYRDHSESAGKSHVFLKALKSDGTPASGIRFVVDWIGRRPDENPGIALTDDNGDGNRPIFIGMDPAKKNGIVFATSIDQAGDRVDGMGLPNNDRVSFVLTFRHD